MAALLSTLSEIVTTVGKQFAQPMKLKAKNNKPKKFLSTRAIRDRQYDVADVFRKWVLAYASQSNENPQCAAFPMDYREFLETYQHKIGCFYADPPYTIDHYSRFYHVLETICLYDYPRLEEMNKKELGKVVMKGLYRSHRHQSPFSIPSQVESAFVGLFERTSQHNCPLLLSYSPFEEGSEDRPRLITLERLEELARKYFDSVEFIAVKQHKHRKLNKTALNTESNANGEIFILCK
jgi:adenine-specific DNA methylase